MEDSLQTTSFRLIADAYEHYRNSVYTYIYSRINHREDAEDLSQDVFLRLMDYKQLLRAETVRSFLFSIARNLVIDYVRRYAKWQEISSYLYDMSGRSTDESESRVVAADLQAVEQSRIRLLPPQRRKIYVMSRFGEKSAAEIADSLHLSRRTVENHLLMGRKEVRAYMKACI